MKLSSRSPAPAPELTKRQISTASAVVPSLTTIERGATTSQRSPGWYQAEAAAVDWSAVDGVDEGVMGGVMGIRAPGGG